MSKLDKRRKGVYGPPLGKKFIIFVDDINLPEKDAVRSQGPIEVLRHMLDHRIWYDSKELFTMKIIDTMVIAAMKPSNEEQKQMSKRFMRHFNTVYVDHFQDSTITAIFSRLVLWHLDTKGFSKDFDPCIEQVVSSTLEIHKFAENTMRPTPDKTHYLFNLRDFSRVILGVLLSTPESMEDLRAMKRLWVHEAMRVYYDRLVDIEDKTSLYTKIQDVTKQCMKEDFNTLFAKLKDTDTNVVTEDKIRALHFCDFLDPNEDEKFYRENTNMNLLRESATSYLNEYNTTSRKPMDLVLFHFALEHLCKISRVLKQPQSNAVLIGVGGSGRRRLSSIFGLKAKI